MEQFLLEPFEPIELTEAELHAVAGGDGAAAAAAGDGLNAAAGFSGGVTITFGSVTATANHAAIAFNNS
jgi:hypothetical protein